MSTKPKILLCFEYGTLNGGEFSMLAMLEQLGKTDFEFVAAAPRCGPLSERLVQCGIQVHPLVLRDTQDRKRPIEQINAHLIELIARIAPDLVHANSLAMGRMIGRIADQLSMPCTAHLRDIIKLNKTTIADLNRNAGLIAVSHATRQFHINQGLQADKVQTLYNGVDTHRFCPAPATGSLKQELGLPHDALLLANIGQICLRKGQTLLAQAAVSLAQEFPNLYTLLIGERHSQKQESIEYEQTIKTIFEDAGLSDRLHGLGFRSDIPTLLNEIDLLVHTSHQEPLGRVLLEAAACGCTIVATDVGGTSEILTHQDSALLIPPNDLSQLTTKLSQALTDPTIRQQLGRRARATALKKFALPMATKKIQQYWCTFL